MTLPFEKGPVSFRRFTIPGKKPPLFDEAHVARLRENARPEVRGTGDVYGWGAGGHACDTEFDLLKQVYVDHLVWDQFKEGVKLPADRLKMYTEVELRALHAASDKPAPTAKMKKQARTAAREQLEREAKDGRWKKWTTVPCVWGLRRNDLYYGGTSLTGAERFLVTFLVSFCANITQEPLCGEPQIVTAGSLAVAKAATAVDERLTCFTAAAPANYPETPSWHAGGPPDWLGCEFLVWLWWMSESNDSIECPDGSKVEFLLNGGVKFDCPMGTTGNVTTNTARGIKSPEARAALSAGKLPRKAALTLSRGGDVFSFKLQAERMEVSGARLPAPSGDLDARARHMDRLEKIEDLYATLEQLYLAFLGRRLASNFWEQESGDIRTWAGRTRRKAA